MRVFVSIGDPLGVGPDLFVRLISLVDQAKLGCHIIGCGPRAMIQRRAEKIQHSITLVPYEDSAHPLPKGQAWHVDTPHAAMPGQVALSALCAAEERVTQNPARHALLTLPVSKERINQSGTPFRGHTGWLAERAGVDSDDVVMTMIYRKLAIAVATDHIPLIEVPKAITAALLVKKIRTLSTILKKGQIITVLGLNPHAGEGGHIGLEDQDCIAPVIKRLATIARGPVASDGAFHTMAWRDGPLLAMYHDQGLAPYKAIARGRGLNASIGLPYRRCSVDHGTADAIAGTHNVSIASARSALDWILSR